MNPLALLPYALGAYGGVQGYRSARDRGASGLGALFSGAAGAPCILVYLVGKVLHQLVLQYLMVVQIVQLS